MTREQFIDAVMEEIFIRGFTCPSVPTLALVVQSDWERSGPRPTRRPMPNDRFSS